MSRMHALAGGNLLDWLAGYGYALHRGCFLDDGGWVTGYVAANWVIALAYALVSLLIYRRMSRARHIPKTVMGISILGIFVTCAAGHFLAGFTTVVWPGYRLETLWHWCTAVPAWIFLANHRRFSLIVEGPHTIQETRQQLAQKNQELNAAYEKIKQLDELKSQFFANVSHELRTPITLILGLSRRLQRDSKRETVQQADLQVIERNARTLLKHVNDLLDIARLQAARMQVDYTQIDLAQLIRMVASNFEAPAEERQQRFTVETPMTLPAQVDPEKIERVVMNVISNALKFTPEGGTIRCELKAAGTTAILTVEDSGPGVPSHLRDTIFERFRQADAGVTRQFGGTGLGLAIAKDFLELHGGTIIVTGSPLGGARFVATIPVQAPPGTQVHSAPGESERAAAQQRENEMMQQAVEEIQGLQRQAPIGTPVPASPQAKSGPEQPLVLIVEDNAEMNRFLAETLSSSYRTETAFDGNEGLQKAQDLRPDLILTDVMMPGRSGDQMLRALRALPEMNDVPIVMLTAKADDELRIRMLHEGAQDYVMKPFLSEEIQARVGNLIMIKRSRQALQIEIDSKTVNLEALTTEMIQRKRELEAANEQFAMAIQEAHHRIKNNLQAVTALLELQMDVRQGEMEGYIPASVIRDSLRQIKAIALVHDMLSHDAPMEKVNVAPVLTSLCKLLSDTFRTPLQPEPIRLHTGSVPLPTKAATALALIVNELVSNAFKHCLALRQAREEQRAYDPITVELVQEPGILRLRVEDPGPGFPADFDPMEYAHVGLELVLSLAASDLQGQIRFQNIPDQNHPGQFRGRVEVRFPPDPISA